MKPVKIINWVAFLLLLTSLFQPMEHHTLAISCSWPCRYPFTFTVFDVSVVFIFSPLLLFFQLLAWAGFETLFMAVVYSWIGIGEISLLLTPLFENKINSQLRQKVHLLFVFLAVVAVLCYGFISDLRYGVEPLMTGYYGLVLSFLLAATASVMRFTETRSIKPSESKAWTTS
jgi:hypothetical protein